MSIKKGHYLGGIRTLDDLRLRCVCLDDADKCWHLLGARRQPLVRDIVHVFGIGGMTATRAAWMLSGKPLMPHLVVFRTCESRDCVNPDHLHQGPRRSVVKQNAASGLYRSPEQIAPLLAASASRRKTTLEMVKLIVESDLSAPALAKVLPISAGRINVIRRERRARPNSVFSWRPAA